MPLKVAIWNVEHFKKKGKTGDETARTDRVIDLLRTHNPDVFAIFEVTGKEVFSRIFTSLNDYDYQITEGQQSQEILVGARDTTRTFMTQRMEFKAGNLDLRPGALLTVMTPTEIYPMLFLHLRSWPTPRGFGVRAHQLDEAFGLRKTLDAGAVRLGFPRANYIFLGDLNTMGMNLTYSSGDIDAAGEIERLEKKAVGYKMQVLPKTHDVTQWGGGATPPGNLDHVVAANHMTFQDVGGGANVQVTGWPEKANDVQKRQWIDDFSDHALLTFTITAP